MPGSRWKLCRYHDGMTSSVRYAVPPEPNGAIAAAAGAVHAVCPLCECAGYERPCWQCGNGRGFIPGRAGFLTSVLQSEPRVDAELRAELRAEALRLGNPHLI